MKISINQSGTFICLRWWYDPTYPNAGGGQQLCRGKVETNEVQLKCAKCGATESFSTGAIEVIEQKRHKDVFDEPDWWV